MSTDIEAKQRLRIRIDGYFESDEAQEFIGVITQTIDSIFENEDSAIAANFVSIKVNHKGKPYELILMRPEPGVETPTDRVKRLELERAQLLSTLGGR